jgi:preprotein translocase subunit YajC
MNHDKGEEERELDILTKDLECLQIEINKVTTRIKDIRSKCENKEPITKTDKKKELQVGDSVIVTGTYRNRKGVTGTIVKITPAQVRLRPHNGNDEFQIYKQNIKLT